MSLWSTGRARYRVAPWRSRIPPAIGDAAGCPSCPVAEIRRDNVCNGGQILWNSGHTPILAVGDFLRERGVDMETQQETANGGMVG